MNKLKDFLLEAIKDGNESSQLDFKSQFDGSTQDCALMAMHVCAMANYDARDFSGECFLVLGAMAANAGNPGQIVGGIDALQDDKQRAQVEEKLQNWIKPSLHIEAYAFRDSTKGNWGALVLRAVNPRLLPFVPSKAAPWAKDDQVRGKDFFYAEEVFIRVGQSTRRATREQFLEIMERQRGLSGPKPSVHFLIDGKTSDVLTLEATPTTEAYIEDWYPIGKKLIEELSWNRVEEREIAIYEEKLKAFLKENWEQLLIWADNRRILRKPIQITFQLEIGGDQPAEDLIVFIKFPNSFLVFEQEMDLPIEIMPHAPPPRPMRKPLWHQGFPTIIQPIKAKPSFEFMDLSSINYVHRDVIVDRPGRIRIDINKAMHNLPYHFQDKKDVVLLVPPSSPGEYEVQVEIHAKNLPISKKHSLKLIVNECSGIPEEEGTDELSEDEE